MTAFPDTPEFRTLLDSLPLTLTEEPTEILVTEAMRAHNVAGEQFIEPRVFLNNSGAGSLPPDVL